MNKQVLRWFVLTLVLVAFGAIETSLAQNNVTFRVRMSIKMREGTFLPGSGDIVRVAGSFNNWGSSTDTLRDIGTVDSVYEKTISLAAGAIEYKYLKTPRGGLDWESVPNRTYTVITGTQSVPLVWFDNDSVFTPAANVPVKFQVNMRVKILEQTFLPGSGDIVRVAGSFNGWGGSTDTLRDIAPTDSIYEKTISLLEHTAIQYKFLKTPRGGIDWESNLPTPSGNREYTVPIGGGTIPVVYFDRDSVVNTPVSATIRWQVDMTAFLQLGWFQPTNRDTMEVRGGFNGWGGTPRLMLARDPLTTATYFVAQPYTGTSGDVIPYKFFMDLDSAGAVIRFPGWNDNRDGHNYEHPYNRGDGNQQFTVPGSGNLETIRGWFYSGINPKGLLLNTTDTVDVTFIVNMGPAKRAAVPFNPATDTAKIVLQDPIWNSAQRKNQGTFLDVRRLTPRAGGGDSVYQVTVRVVGKAHYGLLYGWRYTKLGGAVEESEGAGLGTQGGYRVRFIQPLNPNSFPRNYTCPQDVWLKVIPLPGEIPPFITDVKQDDTPGLPSVYTLSQNYPNPFNPTTTIRYSIPEAAKVTLKVYNLLGQEVATLVNEQQPAGKFVAKFEANTLASGVYFYRLEAGKFSETKKMLLMK
jgi:hypothetical protein